MNKKDDKDFYLKLFPILNQVGDIHVVNYLISSVSNQIFEVNSHIDYERHTVNPKEKLKNITKYKKIKKEYVLLLKTLKQIIKSFQKIEKNEEN